MPAQHLNSLTCDVNSSVPSHAPVFRTKLQSQSISIPLGKRRHRRVSTTPTIPAIFQPFLPLLQCRSRRLHTSAIQRTLQRRRGMVCIVAMGEVRIQAPLLFIPPHHIPAQAARVRCLPVGRCSLLLRRFHDTSFNRVEPRKVRSGIQVRIGLYASSSNQQLSCSLGSLLVMFGYAIYTIITANRVADCNIFKLRRSHGPNKPRKTSSFEGATTIHPRLLLELGLDPLFLHKRETRRRSSLKHLIYTPVSGPFVLGFPDSRHRADSISGSVCLGVLPRRYPDAALRWAGCSSRRRKPATYLTTSGHYHNCTAISSRLLNHASIRHS